MGSYSTFVAKPSPIKNLACTKDDNPSMTSPGGRSASCKASWAAIFASGETFVLARKAGRVGELSIGCDPHLK